MFSGIVETTTSVEHAVMEDSLVRLVLQRPATFTDLHLGDSIATDGVCLTLEKFDDQRLQFALGAETLRITGWTASALAQRRLNLERSLRLNDRIHGHLVTGHVDAMGEVRTITRTAETQTMTIAFQAVLAPFIWKKGSVAINGVSLTVNEASDATLTVGLIPETLRRTNLGALKVGDRVCLEIDNMARGLVHWARHQRENS